jgi:23S rRNA pseudouridine1911/1915/1917 synthase
MHHLAAQFKARTVRKRYLALVYGEPGAPSGTIDRPIGRHPTNRKQMSVHTHAPRPALTHWLVQETFGGASLLDLDIRTGRTHQIRVHCKAMGHPVIGDPVYFNRGDRKRLAAVSERMALTVAALARQMLHAWRLSVKHPKTGTRMAFKAPLPDDMVRLLERFRAIAASR